jgi:hypothetical protein
MRRCDILSASNRGYLNSFVKMVELGMIVTNVERLEFTNRSLEANDIKPTRVETGKLFSLGMRPKAFFAIYFPSAEDWSTLVSIHYLPVLMMICIQCEGLHQE